MKNLLMSGLCVSMLLTACGGGGGGGGGDTTPPVVLAPSVTAVTPDQLMYGKSTKFTVAGQNLEGGITLAAANCANLAESAGGSASQRNFTCTPTSTGAMTVTVKAANGSVLSTTNPVVPQPQVTIKTTMGDIVVELNPANAPITVNNFLQYAADGFYKDTIFHRVINGFVVQGGGFNAALQAATPRAPIKLEVPNGLSNLRGTIAMARTAVADSATSQFFINVVDNLALDTNGGGYAVFGKVVAGMDVVDLIKVVPTQTVGVMTNVPVTPIVVNSATQTK